MDNNLTLGPVDLFSPENETLINPRMPAPQADALKGWLESASHLSSHVFLLTSGSTAASDSALKWVALAKPAILAAAEASNAHLRCTPEDVWLHYLPDFHVGGVGIWARACLARFKVSDLEFTDGWDPGLFVKAADRAEATLTSLVPTQVHDLVQAKLDAPATLRAVIVGAGALDDATYLAARDLGWPLLRSYGMSETASQIATECLEDLPHRRVAADVDYSILPHLEVRGTPEGRLCVRGTSLLTGYVSLDSHGNPHFWDPKDRDGWFVTEDLGEVDGERLFVQGRIGDRIKIGGENVSLGALRKTFDGMLAGVGRSNSLALIAVPDRRLETIIALVVESGTDAETVRTLVERFNSSVMPFERIREQFVVEHIPRSALGKVMWGELSALLPKR